MEARGGERLDLLVPGIPEFGEAVEEYDDGPIVRTGGDGVEFDRAVVKSYVFEKNRHVAEFTWKRDGNMQRRSGRGKPLPYVMEVVSRP
jgi:hypothetical protein